MIIDGKIYRNLPEQVEKNKDDIAKLQEGFTQSGYTKAEADAKFADKIDTENSITGINEYITANRKAMGQLQAKVDKNTTDIAAQDSKIDTATEAATNASGVAQNAYTAATAAKEATDATTVQVTGLTSSVDALDLYTSTLNTDLQSTKNRVTAAEGNIDALSTTVDNINNVIPTDIAVVNGKLGLKHDSTWLANHNAINLGRNLTYNEATNTLNAVGGGGGSGDYYTKEESDAKYAEKASVYTKTESDGKYQQKGTYVVPSDLDIYEKKSDLSTTLEDYVDNTSLSTILSDYELKVDTPTDIAVVNGKLGLKHNSVWLTNQNAINLGGNLTYDAVTNTLNTVGGGGSTGDYYTKAESDEKYQPKGTYVVPSDLDIYEKKSDLSTTLEDYVDTATFSATLFDYALKTDIPTDFYTKAEADAKFADLRSTVAMDRELTIQWKQNDEAIKAVDAKVDALNYVTPDQMNTAINTAITGAIEGAY